MTTVKNLNYLRENNLALYHQIRNSKPNQEKYRISEAKNIQVPTIESLVDNRWTYVHSRFNPLDEARKWVDGLMSNGKAPTNIILFGFGLGYHVMELLKRFPSIRLHIYEPDRNMVLYSIENVDWSNLNFSQISKILINSSKDSASEFFSGLIDKIDDTWLITALPIYQRVYQFEYNNFLDTFKDIKENYIFSFRTTAVFEKNWATNTLENLRYVFNTPSIFECKDNFTGQTVIMTASGPSLEHSKDMIKELQKSKRAIVIAAGTSINSLQNLGITPDFFVSYDPGRPNYEILKPILTKKIPLIFGSTIYYEIVKEHQGDKAHFILSQDSIYPNVNKKFKNEELISDAPTIAAVTLQLLAKLGVKRVILAGQDLAYVDNKFYAIGTSIRTSELTDAEKSSNITVENNEGTLSVTSESFLRMKDSLEDVIKWSDLEVYNLSSKGAKINGTTFITEDKVYELLKENIVKEIKLGSPSKNNDYNKVLADINKKIKFYKNQIPQLEILLQRMREDFEKGKSLKNVFEEIDLVLNNITDKKDFNYLVRPFVRVRLQLASKTLDKIRLTCGKSDIYEKKQELYDYYTKEIGAFTRELKDAINVYDRIKKE